jgi:hypothetical protein
MLARDPKNAGRAITYKSDFKENPFEFYPRTDLEARSPRRGSMNIEPGAVATGSNDHQLE